MRLAPLSRRSALLASYADDAGGASFLEAEAFDASRLVALPPGPSLQGRLKAALPTWRDTLARAPPDAPHGAPVVIVVAGAALVRRNWKNG